MSQHDYVKVLEAAGYADAARVVAAMGESKTEPATPPVTEPEAGAVEEQNTALSPAEAARQGEGRALLDAMKASGALDRFQIGGAL